MQHKNILLTRLTGNSKQTTGYLIVHDQFKTHAQFVSLELVWLNNQKNISCIPPGQYKAVKTLSKTFGWCIKILNVPNRSAILIHFGNYYTNSKGCILVGESFSHINNDNQTDITNSNKSLKKLASHFNPAIPFNITIQPTIYQK